MNFKNTSLIIALLAVSGESFVSNPARGGHPLSHSVTRKVPTTSFGVRSSSTRRWAASMPSPTPSSEVERLQAMAAKLRQEAAGLESEQKAAMVQAAEKIFQKFDLNKDGAISAKELKAGLERVFKVDLPEQRADQLVKEFDTNGDGSLTMDEFVGIDRFRSALDAFGRQERDMVRQEAKEAREQVEAIERSEAQMELVNDKPPTTSDKLVSVLPYLFPLLDGLQFSRFLVEGHQDNPLAIATVAAYALYRAIPFQGFLGFFGLTFLSENPQLNKLVRFNAQQAVVLDVALFFPAILAAVAGGLAQVAGVTDIPAALTEGSSTALFLALLATIAYSSVTSLVQGETPNQIPFVSQYVEDRMITPDMFDENGNYMPLDENGNLKKPNNKADDEDDEKN